MAPKIPWLERPWSLDFPVELHFSLVERLRGTPARLEEMVAGLPADVRTRRDGESWSIQENVGHMADLEYLPRVRAEEILAGAEVMTAWEGNQATDDANHNAADVAELLRDFRAQRERLVELLDGLSTDDFARSAQHPRVKTRMRLVDLCFFQAEHDDHHLARITELKRTFRPS